MKFSVDGSTSPEPEDFSSAQGFALIAETPEEMEQLRRIVLQRGSTSLRAVHFSFEFAPGKPMTRIYTSVDIAMVSDGVFEPREVDNQTVKK